MAANAKIRVCSLGDETALSLIGQATFLETFAGILGGRDIISHSQNAHSVTTYSAWLKNPRYKLWLAETELGRAPIGYMAVAPPELPTIEVHKDDLELKRIYLLSKFQGAGLGKTFLTQAIDHAKKSGAGRLLLGVYANNTSAIEFYKKAGFIKLGIRKFNVGGQDYDDIIMGMSLKA